MQFFRFFVSRHPPWPVAEGVRPIRSVCRPFGRAQAWVKKILVTPKMHRTNVIRPAEHIYEPHFVQKNSLKKIEIFHRFFFWKSLRKIHWKSGSSKGGPLETCFFTKKSKKNKNRFFQNFLRLGNTTDPPKIWRSFHLRHSQDPQIFFHRFAQNASRKETKNAKIASTGEIFVFTRTRPQGS